MWSFSFTLWTCEYISGVLFGYQMCSWGRESAVGSFAARSCAPPRSSPSATACTSSMRSTQRWSPALWTPSSLIWPGKRDRYATPNQLPVMNMTSQFPPLQDQYAQKTGRTWTNENPSAVRPDSPDFKRLRSVSGGPRTHTEVWFPHLQTLQELFILLRRFNGLEMFNLVSECLRGLFIIDDKGVLRQITMNDLPVGRSVDETLRLVQAFQYTDKHGEGTGNKCGMG